MQDPKQAGAEHEVPSGAETVTIAADSGAATTVRCSVPEEAAATLRIANGESPREHPLMPAQRFRDLGEIARGGMSSVRKVWDELILRETAMKVLAKERNFDALLHFVEEAQITGQLDHPNIVPVHDIELDEKGLPSRFTMKLVRGQTLQAVLHEVADRELAGDELVHLLQVFVKICDAVAFAHSRGVIHRDLKPGNIMVGSFGQVYVMDWGVALLRAGARASQGKATASESVLRRSLETQPESPGTLTGTPSYMAPEQAQGRIADVDERTDVYGLGGILYQILTSRPPHDGVDTSDDLRLARIGRILSPTDVATNRTLPPLLVRITTKALSLDPSERHASVLELQREVEGFLRGGGWFTQKRFVAGAEIVREGDSADAAYIIQTGECELHKNVGGQRRFVRTLGPGDVFGEAAIFGSSQRTATIIARDEVVVLVVTRDALERELDRSHFLRAFVEALGQRFVELDRRVRDSGEHKTAPASPNDPADNDA